MTPHRQRSGRPSARRGGGARGAGAAARTPPPSSRICLRAGPTPTSLRPRPPRPPGRRSGPGSTAATTSSTACLCASQVPGPGRGGRGRAGRAGQRLAVRVVPTDVGGVGFPALCHVIVPKPVCPGERRASLSAGAPSRGWRSPAPSQEGSCPALQRLLRVRPILPTPHRPPLPSFLGLVDSSGLREKMTVLSLPGELRDGSEQKKRCLFSVFR